MAYSKQTWTDDVSAVTGARMTHIEQGIYDNSLATDKINPSGTATTTAEIEEGQITDVIGFKSLKLKGQTSQVSYDGYNILNGIIENKTTNGVTITKNEDNSYKVSGTATAVALFSTNINTTLEANKTYVMGFGNSNSNVQLSIRPSDGSTQYANTTTQKYVTYTPNENIDIRLFVRVANGATVNETIYPIIYVGNTEKSYEPYVGGEASPNPDFPQDVNNVSGDNVIGISNKNINSSTLEVGNISNGANTTDTNVVRSKDYIMVTPSTAYTFSINGTANKVVVSMYDENKVFLTNDGANGYASSNGKFTTYSNAKYIRYRSYSADKSLFESGNIQLEKGTSATSFVAHQGNNFSIDLPVENLLDITTADRNNQGVSLYNNHNGTVTLNGKATATSGGLSLLSSNTSLPVSAFNGTITFSVKEPLPTGVELAFAYGDSTGTWISNIARLVGSTKSVTATINPPSNAVYFRVNFSVASGTELKNLLVCPQLEKGNKANAFTPYGTNPIEICKIGTYQDYIYKKDGKWWKHKEIEKAVLDGTENWAKSGNTSVDRFWLKLYDGTLPSFHNMYSNKFNYKYNVSDLNVAWIDAYQTEERLFVNYSTYNTTTLAQFKTWLASALPIFYYPIATPIDEEITYAPLLRQLDEIYNSGLYNETNISQDNSSEAFILDLEACKNNINGIVEYIRR